MSAVMTGDGGGGLTTQAQRPGQGAGPTEGGQLYAGEGLVLGCLWLCGLGLSGLRLTKPTWRLWVELSQDPSVPEMRAP